MSTNYTQIFHTVPFTNPNMTRNSDGAKVDTNGNTISSKGSWHIYADEYNTDNTPILGAIALNEFIGIDLDTDQHFIQVLSILNSIDHRPTYIAKSLPEELQKGGHILFAYDTYTAEILGSVSKYLKKLKIDIQIGKKLIYLATNANKTKHLVTVPLTSINDLTAMPKELIAYLSGLAVPMLLEDTNKQVDNQANVNNSITTKQTDYYGYILQDTLSPDIVQRLTPKKDYAYITDMNDIPDGSGTDWLLQVRKKLQVDKSVSAEVMLRTMLYLNSLWNVPMDTKRVESDTLRDIKSNDFVFSPNWKKEALILVTDTKQTIEVIFVPSDASYLLFNRTAQEVTKYTTFTAVSDVLMALTDRKLPKEIVLRKASKVHIISSPLYEPFIQAIPNSSLPVFNTFIPSEGLQIVRDGTKLSNYKEPKLILDFLANLIPEKDIRDKFTKYLAYKYYTYDYSPLYFVMAGVGGAGKGVLVHEILTYLSSHLRIQSVDFSTLVNNFNSYMAEIDWLEIEEAGEGYSKKDNEKLVGTLKRVTGNAYISIERKGKDVITQRHFITPIISTNLNTKLITDTVVNDRRLVLLKCPNKLTNIIPYTMQSGEQLINTREFIEELRRELPHFAYYLGRLHTSSQLDTQDYLDNHRWKNDDYLTYIEDTMTEHEKLYQAAELKDVKKFTDILLENRVPKHKIDKMFSLSDKLGGIATCILYHTSATEELDVPSVEDLYLVAPTLNGNTRTDYKRIKVAKSVRENFKIYRVQIIQFDDIYIPLDTVPAISDSSKLDNILDKQ